jgi:hypothetical protein
LRSYALTGIDRARQDKVGREVTPEIGVGNKITSALAIKRAKIAG